MPSDTLNKVGIPCIHYKKNETNDHNDIELLLLHTENMCVDQYLQRRRIDPVEAEQEIVEKLEAMQEQEEPLLHASTVGMQALFMSQRW